MISAILAFAGSLLVAVTVNEESMPTPAEALMLATSTSLPLGGHSVQPGAGIPMITGGGSGSEIRAKKAAPPLWLEL